MSNYYPKQQGNILLVVLLALLVLGGVVISSLSTDSAQKREAIGQEQLASLEAAMQAAIYEIKAKAGQVEKTNPKASCQAINTKLSNELLSKNNKFMTQKDEQREVSWSLYNLEPNCSLDEPEITSFIKAWQGNEAKPLTELKGKINIAIKEVSGDGSGAEDSATSKTDFDNLMKNKALVSYGRLDLNEGASIGGNVQVNSDIKLTGGVAIQGDFSGANIDTTGSDYLKDRDWYKNNAAEGFIPVDYDPLKLQEEIATNSQLKNLPMLNIKQQLNGKSLGEWPFDVSTAFPNKLETFDKTWDVQANKNIGIEFQAVDFLGTNRLIGRVNELTLPNGVFNVRGGDVTLFVDGNVTLSGGLKIDIDDESSLTLIVTGKFNLQTGDVFVNQIATNNQGKARFVLLLANTDNNAFKIAGGSKIYGFVYSLAKLNLLEGAGIVGQVYGTDVLAKGGTAIEFQEVITGLGPTSNSGADDKVIDTEFDFEYDYE